MKKRILFFLAAVLLLLSMQLRPSFIETSGETALPPHIIIDAGHGGDDPGKVGIHQTLEKDINLSIALSLRHYLSAAGYRVQMIRDTDRTLADPDASNQKLSDFKNRAAFINGLSPMAVISIHQNSYPDEAVKGSQVFYKTTDVSRQLASCIQKECTRILDKQNHRQIKSNTDYYLFRHVDCPIVIVECGFLSNTSETALLSTKEYQEKVAWAIHMGTLSFLKQIE